MAAILIAIGGFDQGDHADLDEILDLDRRSDPGVDVPGDLAHQRHVLTHQHFRPGARAAAVGVDGIILA